ncbi:LysR family transcriptional regulator [Primorskyibacter sedentarius]|uniref:DNA-binding transcriptional LysR family regulator n=1 Tax=Primorskyibacter sedentarius TaxID=745311 RepID=A0A4R3JI82_9RHOB|nr:LysR family transcriptional regulator [Primorskyibacter sedentarius]TCS65734.1 DNA-binding transcriptional LysR family regulator [Primorskyibacter sedentarius]
MRNLDITTLRSFVAVAQSGGVTRASGFLNLTQSAVSMQIKRLEELLGLTLLDRSGRKIALTAAGEQLLAYARRMVTMNDEIFARLTDQDYEGELMLGVPHDIVYPVIPQVLQRFSVEYPRVKVQLLSSYTSNLKEQFRRGEIDVILTTESGLEEGGETLIDVPLRWIGAPGGSAWRQRPLRLAFCRFCLFRPGALGALDAAGLEWEMAVESDNDRTIEATVSADLAITAMLEGHAPPYLEHISTAGTDLPDLGTQRINLYGNSAKPEMVAQLQSMIRQGFGAF